MSSDMTADRNQVINLWNEAFGDSPGEINDFLDIFGDCILTEEENGRIASQLFMIPGSLNSYKAFYLYAAATSKKSRGKGLMTKLLSEAAEYAKANKADYILLMPGEESLYGYYEKHGYRSLCFRKECTLEADKIPKIETKLRNFYTHDKRVYEYAGKVYGEGFEIFGNGSGSVIYGTEDGCISVKEWHSEDIASLLKEFAAAFCIKKIKISLPADSISEGSCEIKKHGMILPLGTAPCEGMYYLDYVLD